MNGFDFRNASLQLSACPTLKLATDRHVTGRCRILGHWQGSTKLRLGKSSTLQLCLPSPKCSRRLNLGIHPRNLQRSVIVQKQDPGSQDTVVKLGLLETEWLKNWVPKETHKTIFHHFLQAPNGRCWVLKPVSLWKSGNTQQVGSSQPPVGCDTNPVNADQSLARYCWKPASVGVSELRTPKLSLGKKCHALQVRNSIWLLDLRFQQQVGWLEKVANNRHLWSWL